MAIKKNKIINCKPNQLEQLYRRGLLCSEQFEEYKNEKKVRQVEEVKKWA